MHAYTEWGDKSTAAINDTAASVKNHPACTASGSRAVDVAVQTDFQLLHQESSQPGMPSQPGPAQLITHDSPAAPTQQPPPGLQGSVPQAAAASSPAVQQQGEKLAAAALEVAGNPQVAPTQSADCHEKTLGDRSAQRDMLGAQSAGCQAESDAGSQASLQSEPHLSASASRAHSSSSSGSVRQSPVRNSAVKGHRSSTNALLSSGAHYEAELACSSTGAAVVDRQQDDAVSEGAQDRIVPIVEGSRGRQQKAKQKADGKGSRGLQLPQKLSIASLAKHAGVDKAFMQVGCSRCSSCTD